MTYLPKMTDYTSPIRIRSTPGDRFLKVHVAEDGCMEPPNPDRVVVLDGGVLADEYEFKVEKYNNADYWVGRPTLEMKG